MKMRWFAIYLTGFLLLGRLWGLTEPTPQRDPIRVESLFEGTWKGTLGRGLLGSLDLTFVVSADGAAVTFKSKSGSFTWQGSCDGKTVRWHGCAAGIDCDWTLTPNEDGKTAVVTDRLLVGTFSAIFQKESSAHQNKQ
jgi:hypothetical protein